MATAVASPAKIQTGLHSGKSGGLTANCKLILNEQHQRLSSKHSTDLELIDDLRTFIKVKCHIEKDYCNAIIKLVNSHQSKKFPQYKYETDNDVKTIYSAWKIYLEELEKVSKNRLTLFDQVNPICDTLKQMKSHKSHVGKKAIDVHFKKMHEDIISAVAEIDKTKKTYFDEESTAKSARDKEEKLKKRKGGIFSKFTDLQSKKEKSSVHREASEIQSTQARNEYILALVSGNAHLNHHFSIDLPNLFKQLDDEILDKCRGFMTTLIETEINSLNNSYESFQLVSDKIEATSCDLTNTAFLSEQNASCLRDVLQVEFDPCENDQITVISKDYNAELALQTEITKWLTCYKKDCRNLNRLSQQLIKCQTMQAGGQKTVEVTGVGQVDIEARIDDIKQQLRKCDISKVKAYARLTAIKEGDMDIEDLESIEVNITTEMKQSSLDVDVNPLPLSRTPSMRSTNGRQSAISEEKNIEIEFDRTPEPPEVITAEFDNESPEPEVEDRNLNSYQYESAYQYDFDPTAVWDEQEDQNEGYANTDAVSSQENEVTGEDDQRPYSDQTCVFDINNCVGKRCQALYTYETQNVDELSFLEGEILKVIEVDDKDWVKAQNEKNEIGYIPVAYVQLLDDGIDYTESIDYSQRDEPEPESEKKVELNESLDDIEYVRALYDYNATSNDEISFQEGDLIKIIDRSEDGWWLGEKNGVKGHFPSMLVEDSAQNDDNDEMFDEEDEIIDEIEETDDQCPSELALPPGPPPPSFAPPKPAYLTPNQFVIIQPTPDVESRDFCDTVEDDTSKASEENEIENDTSDVKDEAEENSENEFVLEKPRVKIKNGDEDNNKEIFSITETHETQIKDGVKHENITVTIVTEEIIEPIELEDEDNFKENEPTVVITELDDEDDAKENNIAEEKMQNKNESETVKVDGKGKTDAVANESKVIDDDFNSESIQ